ncbi:hypothetical protein TNCT_633571 [Trichonephila clavata]|uniref:Uncharacterized protein n=1 Tax=Trichonephila clavata TaxID=2740835 RepID=A0A8X6F408_TRICU|nr:hypothetical protein TNCT_633571 [Trichonephila clavata]
MNRETNKIGFNFAKTLTVLVAQNMYPEVIQEDMKKTKLQDCYNYHLWIDLIPRILGKWKMEMYFVLAEELSIQCQQLNDKSFCEMMQQLKEDFRSDDFDPAEFFCFCILVSFYATIALKRNCQEARKVAVRTIYDNVQYYEERGQMTESSWKTIFDIATQMAYS